VKSKSTTPKLPKPEKITTIEIECEIAKHFDMRRNIIVPNISFGLSGMHECDMFIIRPTGYAIEVEIKISRSDLLADFKKGHNHVDRWNRICEFYYAMPWDLYDKCKDLIPENAGVITCEWYYNAYYMKWYMKTHTERKAVRINGARPLTEAEQFKVAKLGTMRIWTLKAKIIKNDKAKVQQQAK
jgi:hypothetical protein